MPIFLFSASSACSAPLRFSPSMRAEAAAGGAGGDERAGGAGGAVLRDGGGLCGHVYRAADLAALVARFRHRPGDGGVVALGRRAGDCAHLQRLRPAQRCVRAQAGDGRDLPAAHCADAFSARSRRRSGGCSPSAPCRGRSFRGSPASRSPISAITTAGRALGGAVGRYISASIAGALLGRVVSGLSRTPSAGARRSLSGAA